MFYDNFLKMCSAASVTPTQVARSIGVRQSTVSMWKKQGTTPKYETLQKLAAYFGVSIDTLIGIETFDSGAEFDKRRQEIIDSFKGKDTTEVAVAYKPGGEVSRLEITHTTPPITRINNALDCLNDEGQRAAAERVEELTEIPKYQADKTPPESK